MRELQVIVYNLAKKILVKSSWHGFDMNLTDVSKKLTLALRERVGEH